MRAGQRPVVAVAPDQRDAARPLPRDQAAGRRRVVGAAGEELRVAPCGDRAHTVPSASAQAASATASTRRSPSRIAGRSHIAAVIAPPRSVPANGASADHRQRAAGAEREPDRQPQRRVAERDADSGERPDREGQHERREAEPEQHAVAGRRERHGQHAPPRLRHLAADLRRDPQPARLGHRGGDRDDRGGADRRRPAGAQRGAREREPPERDRAAGERAERERGAGCQRRAQPPRVAVRGERVDHREAARRPRAGHPGGERCGDQARGQHDRRGYKLRTDPAAPERPQPDAKARGEAAEPEPVVGEVQEVAERCRDPQAGA